MSHPVAADQDILNDQFVIINEKRFLGQQFGCMTQQKTNYYHFYCLCHAYHAQKRKDTKIFKRIFEDKTPDMRALLAFSIFLSIHTVATAQQFLLPAEGPFDQVRVAGNIHLQLIASNTMQLLFEEEAIPENLDVAWDENILTLKIPIDLKKKLRPST